MGRGTLTLALLAAFGMGTASYGCVSPEANAGSNDPPAAAAPCQPVAPAPTPAPAPMPAPVMPQPAPAAPPTTLERRVETAAPAASGIPWQGYDYPIAAEDMRGVRFYRIFQTEGDSYIARVGLVLEAAPGAYVRYHRGMFAFGDRIAKTDVIASGDAGPDGFPDCGRYVRLRHTFAQPIPGIGGSIDTLYCNFELRDAHTVVGMTVPDDAPDGGIILGAISKGDGTMQPPRLTLFMLADGATYNTPIAPLGVLRAR